jgi:glyoxylase-like metal-dependent hydrolase (beta-lactamase superfamily II)
MSTPSSARTPYRSHRRHRRCDGKPLFPNAQVYISQADLEFWTDEKKMDGPLRIIVHARKNLMLARPRRLLQGRSGIPARHHRLAAPGHTFGHHMFMIQSDGKSFASSAT